MLGGEDLAGETLVTGVIGELQGVQRPDLETQALQGKHRRRIADVAIGHMRLDRKDVHGFYVVQWCNLRLQSSIISNLRGNVLLRF